MPQLVFREEEATRFVVGRTHFRQHNVRFAVQCRIADRLPNAGNIVAHDHWQRAVIEADHGLAVVATQALYGDVQVPVVEAEQNQVGAEEGDSRGSCECRVGYNY